MLTVDFDRLGVTGGTRLLDLGCGGGRHAFEAWRRGSIVIPFDRSEGDLKDVRGILGAMIAADELPNGQSGGVVNGDALALPFADATFDQIIASEILEHVPNDRGAIKELVRVLKPGGRMAVTVPTRWPERINWALDYHYHDVPGGHIRIYRQPELENRLEEAGCALRGSHHAHALHSPYWWLRSAVGINKADDHWAVKRYHDLLAWQITKQPAWLARIEKSLSPLMGKSLVVYVERVS
ncbi:unannotated protein [freshwater metagenome]|uniref:Unannotated protein n=1 Tax=freshwater metagenome TaxID=449393 RepID=A0A6J7G673_9ZZZZ|nr:class I SAM-dependent methyltransferase [Acidimicrobiia bacterium]MCX6503643.1 class I SAM-dependent methyltransferase [Actinomycetota bacterium]GDX30993.1 methyltransferase [Actinomycetes bacterium]MSV40873.1 methyltransferase domain-containing protein [Actinomycetota bacterium]MSV95268.1 methyltransferase domain-containing protein [Actinomycetota bacterium]